MIIEPWNNRNDRGRQICAKNSEAHGAIMPLCVCRRTPHRARSRRGGSRLRSIQEIGAEVGASVSTIDRVKTILEEGSYEQIKALKSKSQMGEGSAVRTVYEQVQQEAIKVKVFERIVLQVQITSPLSSHPGTCMYT
jgi:hypothetical protein